MPNIRQVLGLKSLALILFLLTSCQPRDKASLLYQKTLEAFDPERPGYSLDASATDQKLDHPMAYALFASAEAKRYQLTQDQKALDNSLNAIKWLIDNKISKDNGTSIGWGLPFAWDAFGDGSTNSEDTIYGITTALVIQSLLDVYEVSLERKEKNISYIDELDLIRLSYLASNVFIAKSYEKIPNKEEIVFWYSDQKEDNYHVLNVSAMLAGQIQRLSQYVDIKQSEKLKVIADQAILYILHEAQKDEQGRVFWLYGGDSWPEGRLNRPNDLVHEAYVIQGLLDYKRYKGTHAEKISLNALYESLERFLDDHQIYEFPKGWKNSSNKPIPPDTTRLWAAGYSSYIASELERLNNSPVDLSQKFLCTAINQYYADGKWYYQPNKKDTAFYSRQVSHMLISLAANPETVSKCLK